MQQSLGELEIAVRVLGAVTKGRRPDAHDVELLRALAPDAPIMDVDELACDVIQMAISRRAKVRAASQSPTS
jgi:hypothetical protein